MPGVLRGALPVAIAALAAAGFAATVGLGNRPATAAVEQGSCARLFRQSVRTLSDRAAKRITRRVTPERVSRLVSLRRPRRVKASTSRLGGAERRTYRIKVRLVAARLGAGGARTGEIELVVADPSTGQRMVVGFADPACRGQRAAAARSARASFLTACGAPPETYYARLTGTARIAGVGFFGPRAGPFATRNGLQLRPATDFHSDDCVLWPEPPRVVAAAGDIACDPDNPLFNGGQGAPRACRMLATSDVLLRLKLDAVLPLGDTQYDYGAPEAYPLSYEPTWGRVKAISHPVIGNHEYLSPRAEGYFDYFGHTAGPLGRGYYSFDLGAWHVVVLNANCSIVRCRAGSPQEKWLRDDLVAHTNGCVLALWHQALFSSGWSRGTRAVRPFWDDLYKAGADLVLNGHDHDYERFAPQSPSGSLDSSRGIREFVVGTGGSYLGPWTGIAPNSEVRENHTFGVLKLTLRDASYDWEFVPVAGSEFTDSGSGACH